MSWDEVIMMSLDVPDFVQKFHLQNSTTADYINEHGELAFSTTCKVGGLHCTSDMMQHDDQCVTINTRLCRTDPQLSLIVITTMRLRANWRRRSRSQAQRILPDPVPCLWLRLQLSV